MKAYLLLVPALLILGLTTFYPIAQAFYLSFTDYDLMTAPRWVGLDNYLTIAADPVFWLALRNTLVFLVLVVPVLVVCPLGLAILVNRPWPGMPFFRLVYYLPVVFSVVVAAIAWKWIYAERGLLNGLLSTLSGHDVRWGWLTDPHLVLFSVGLVTIWKGLGYYMVVYLGGLQGIPPSLYEAAALDGVTSWQKHWHVTVPQLRPYVILVAVLSTIAAMKVFEEVYLMTRGGPANSSLTVVYYLYEQGITRLQMGYASAVGTVLLAVIGVMVWIGLSWRQRWEQD